MEYVDKYYQCKAKIMIFDYVEKIGSFSHKNDTTLSSTVLNELTKEND